MKRYIVFPTRYVPFTSIVLFHGVPHAQCVDASRHEQTRGLDLSNLTPLYLGCRQPSRCNCGGVDSDGDGNCHRCAPRRTKP